MNESEYIRNLNDHDKNVIISWLSFKHQAVNFGRKLRDTQIIPHDLFTKLRKKYRRALSGNDHQQKLFAYELIDYIGSIDCKIKTIGDLCWFLERYIKRFKKGTVLNDINNLVGIDK